MLCVCLGYDWEGKYILKINIYISFLSISKLTLDQSFSFDQLHQISYFDDKMSPIILTRPSLKKKILVLSKLYFEKKLLKKLQKSDTKGVKKMQETCKNGKMHDPAKC